LPGEAHQWDMAAGHSFTYLNVATEKPRELGGADGALRKILSTGLADFGEAETPAPDARGSRYFGIRRGAGRLGAVALQLNGDRTGQRGALQWTAGRGSSSSASRKGTVNAACPSASIT
jgi:hypothetical protein